MRRISSSGAVAAVVVATFAWASSPLSAATGIGEISRARAEAFTKHLVAGTIWVNCFFVRDLSAPFGGSGRSGIGREGGIWSFDFYCDVKNSVFAPKGWN
mgnify:CR=1 FL=1